MDTLDVKKRYDDLSRQTATIVRGVVLDIFRNRSNYAWKDTFHLPWIEVSPRVVRTSWNSLKPVAMRWMRSRALCRASYRIITPLLLDAVYSVPPALGLYAPRVFSYVGSETLDALLKDECIDLETLEARSMEVVFPWEVETWDAGTALGLIVYTTQAYLRLFFVLYDDSHALNELPVAVSTASEQRQFLRSFLEPFKGDGFVRFRTLAPWAR